MFHSIRKPAQTCVCLSCISMLILVSTALLGKVVQPTIGYNLIYLVSVSPPPHVYVLSPAPSFCFRLSIFLSPSVAFSLSLLPCSPSICLRGGFTNRVLDRREECRESGLFSSKSASHPRLIKYRF